MNVPNGLPSLAKGSHKPGSGQACVMEYVALLAGEVWSDSPSCTHPALAAAARNINDSLPDSDRYRLVPLIGRLFGSNIVVDEKRLASWAARSVEKNGPPEAAACNDVVERYLDGRATLEELLKARSSAYAASAASYAYAASSASSAAKVEWLSAFIDEFDRLSGRAEHREVTSEELAELSQLVSI